MAKNCAFKGAIPCGDKQYSDIEVLRQPETPTLLHVYFSLSLFPSLFLCLFLSPFLSFSLSLSVLFLSIQHLSSEPRIEGDVMFQKVKVSSRSFTLRHGNSYTRPFCLLQSSLARDRKTPQTTQADNHCVVLVTHSRMLDNCFGCEGTNNDDVSCSAFAGTVKNKFNRTDAA